MTRLQRAFTLIELLVVVTIITVLLALLAPALDQALYQAELTVCATKQKAMGLGLTSYAADHKRRYPYRTALHEGAHEWPTTVSLGGTVNASTNGRSSYDYRPMLEAHFGLNATLNCPMITAVDIAGSRADSIVLGSFNWFAGFQYQSFLGMHKLGDRWGWNDTYNGQVLSSNVLTSTPYLVASNGRTTGSSHPDKAGTSAQGRLQDGYGYELAAEWNMRNYGTTNMTAVGWGTGDPARGAVDLNTGYGDLSVRRLTDVAWRDDDRVATIGEYSTGKNYWIKGRQLVARQ